VSELLDGVLAFVLPTSLLNCSWYEPTRKYIHARCQIITVCPIGKFPGTGQEVMLFVIKTGSTDNNFIFESGPNIYFTPDNSLLEITKGSNSLKSLGGKVKVGNVVWNEHKEKISTEGTLLVFSDNISNGEIILGREKQYIKGFNKPPIVGPVILLNRGYGNKFKFDYAVFNPGYPFYVENHILVIVCNDIDSVVKSFSDPRTQEFCRIFVRNGNLSCKDLENIFPIF
jgi:hypothetical protein